MCYDPLSKKLILIRRPTKVVTVKNHSTRRMVSKVPPGERLGFHPIPICAYLSPRWEYVLRFSISPPRPHPSRGSFTPHARRIRTNDPLACPLPTRGVLRTHKQAPRCLLLFLVCRLPRRTYPSFFPSSPLPLLPHTNPCSRAPPDPGECIPCERAGQRNLPIRLPIPLRRDPERPRVESRYVVSHLPSSLSIHPSSSPLLFCT